MCLQTANCLFSSLYIYLSSPCSGAEEAHKTNPQGFSDGEASPGNNEKRRLVNQRTEKKSGEYQQDCEVAKHD